MADVPQAERKKSILTDRKKSLVVDDRRKSTVSVIDRGDRKSSQNMMVGKSFSRMRMRRQSYGFGSVPGIRPVERTSQVGFEFKRPPLLYLNTFQLNSYRKFHIDNVTKVANEMLDELFTDHKYNAQNSPLLAIRIAGELMRKVKSMDFNRYRIISIVTIGQKRAQSYNNAVTFLWDHERDAYIDVEREVTTCFIQITLFAIYFD